MYCYLSARSLPSSSSALAGLVTTTTNFGCLTCKEAPAKPPTSIKIPAHYGARPALSSSRNSQEAEQAAEPMRRSTRQCLIWSTRKAAAAIPPYHPGWLAGWGESSKSLVQPSPENPKIHVVSRNSPQFAPKRKSTRPCEAFDGSTTSSHC